jgi:succinate-semialdehyde dehydrogenase / glutarate-semialdehyde dehydrogenase
MIALQLPSLRRLLSIRVEVLAVGKQHLPGGAFFEPIVLEGVTEVMLTASEEAFDSAAVLYQFSTEEEAICTANDTAFRLAPYFNSRDIDRICWVAAALKCGMIGINEGIALTEAAPFGEMKEPGNG